MLRKLMGGMIALMLVATLLLPVASVGAQEEEIELGAAPVSTEETIPKPESPPVHRGATDRRIAAGGSGCGSAGRRATRGGRTHR